RPDTSELNALLKEYGNKQKNDIKEQQRLMERILHKVERSVLLPSWAIKLTWGLLVTVLLVLGFSIYKVSRISKKEQVAYVEGQDDAIEHYRTFFEESPEAKELYQKWLEDNGQK
ncbi:MAG TPA: hypothetical protein DEF18_00225, partial [Muricauda sp.]|nr:hypothetical protein [Allomuricauda sp.]